MSNPGKTDVLELGDLATEPLALFALRELVREPQQSQRKLASTLGVSLGTVNYVVRALLKAGLVKAHNVRTSENRMAYLYLLTPAGIAAKAALTNHFLQRKAAEYAALRVEIAQWRAELDGQLPDCGTGSP